MKQSSSVALLILALAACKPATEANNAAATEPNAAAPTDIEALPPSEDVIPPIATNEAANSAMPVPPNPAPVIPAAFRGRWGMGPADCTTTRGDDKGLITIDYNSIKFYEARATLSKTTMDAPENFTGEFAFTGEGQTWIKSENLKLVGSSNTLIRTESDPAVKLTYKRC
jgi:hypothetical protein